MTQENLNLKVTHMSKEFRIPCNFKVMNIKQLLNFIDTKNYDDDLKEELKKSVKSYPQQALARWFLDFDIHVSKARQVLNKKRNAQSNAEVESVDHFSEEEETL